MRQAVKSSFLTFPSSASYGTPAGICRLRKDFNLINMPLLLYKQQLFKHEIHKKAIDEALFEYVTDSRHQVYKYKYTLPEHFTTTKAYVCIHIQISTAQT